MSRGGTNWNDTRRALMCELYDYHCIQEWPAAMDASELRRPLAVDDGTFQLHVSVLELQEYVEHDAHSVRLTPAGFDHVELSGWRPRGRDWLISVKHWVLCCLCGSLGDEERELSEEDLHRELPFGKECPALRAKASLAVALLVDAGWVERRAFGMIGPSKQGVRFMQIQGQGGLWLSEAALRTTKLAFEITSIGRRHDPCYGACPVDKVLPRE